MSQPGTSSETLAQGQIISHEFVRLLELIATKDESALAAFYNATVTRVYALAVRIVRDGAAAEEVVSDTYMQVWEQAHRFDAERASPMVWLYMMCRSRALDRLRRRDEAFTHEDPLSLKTDRQETGDGPLDLLLELDHDTEVHKAVSALEQRERELLALAFFRGLSHREIAHFTDTPLGSVKTLLRNAMQKLKTALGQYAPGA